MPSVNLNDVGSRLRSLASSGARVLILPHTIKAMKDDSLYRADVEDMLCACRVTQVEDSGGEETWRAEGVDFDGRPIAAIVVAYEDENPPSIKVITCWVKK